MIATQFSSRVKLQHCSQTYDKNSWNYFNVVWMYLVLDPRPSSAPGTSSNQSTCDSPPEIDNALYQPQDRYPEGAYIYYYCQDGFNGDLEANNRLTCAKLDQNRPQWLGEQIQCKSSTALGKITLTVSTLHNIR